MKELAAGSLHLALRHLPFALASAVLIMGAAVPSSAQIVVYNSIPNPLPGNVSSEGPEAYAYSQIGDGFTLLSGGGTLNQITVILSSWACTSGSWTVAAPAAGSCVTTPGATFTLPITVNVYSVMSGTSLEGDNPRPAPGTLLATLTQNFAVPYRPSSDVVDCPSGEQWYDPATATCYHGLATPITFNLMSLNVTLPSQIIVGFQFNTTDYGPHPIGVTACNATTEGCFYDSLNISTDSNGGVFPAVGSVLDPNGIFFNYTLPGNSCSGAAATGVFGEDEPCWAGYHPEIQVTVDPDDNGFQVHYSANLNIGESYIDITNDGANGASLNGPGFGAASGNLCVNVYAFDPNEELVSCCSCLVTPDQTVNLGVNADLTSKTLTGVVPTSVTVKLVATLAGAGGAGTGTVCNNSAASIASVASVVHGLAAWGTTLHQGQPTGTYTPTETPFTPATLSPGELASIVGRCGAIIGNASGFGICTSCRNGALGGQKL